jgi:hypothetical protein
LRARLYLDEDVLPDLARVLRAAGHDVTSAHESDALGLSDEDQLRRATDESRALLTFNYRHYLKLGRDWFLARRNHSGIIVSYRQYRRNELRELSRRVSQMLTTLSAEDLEDSVWVLDQFQASALD